MPKKLLLAFVNIGCFMTCAEVLSTETMKDLNLNKDAQNISKELNGNTKQEPRILSEEEQYIEDLKIQRNFLDKSCLLSEELSHYEKHKKEAFKVALYQALLDSPTAINDLVSNNEKEYNDEEQKDKKLQDDSAVGSWGTSATKKSINGRIGDYIIQRKKGKAEINNKLKSEFDHYKNIFVKEINTTLFNELEHKSYLTESSFLQAIDKCGLNEACLNGEGVSLSMLTKEGFFDQFIHATFNSVIKEAKDKSIPLTEKEIIAIAKKAKFIINGKPCSIEEIEEVKKKILNKIRSLSLVKKS